MENSIFSLDAPTLAWVALGVALLCALYIVVIVASRIRRVVGAQQESIDAPLPTSDLPAVSVVVYAHNTGAQMASLIDAIFGQDYPSAIEVIIAHDESSEDNAKDSDFSTTDVITTLQQRYSHLTVTYVPLGARNVSRKKLAITLGVKAASHPVIVVTDGHARITSHDWLRCMTRHFISTNNGGDGATIVIGYASLVEGDNEYSKPLSRRIAFDQARDGVRYLSCAIKGHTYRGDSANLAYLREAFFAHRGFADYLNLRAGDDDLFVASMAERFPGVAVELSPASIIEIPDDMPSIGHREKRHQRDFTRQYLSQWPFRLWGSVSLAWWLWLGATAATIVLAIPYLIPLIAVAIIWIGLWLSVMIYWRRACKALMTRRLFFTVPFLSLWYPLYNLKFRWLVRRHTESQYTWSENFKSL
ncbi:MAG: glycosyltransferase [Bacteroidales bacterium]|nr:glycosyltransferase [Bacteroidales bacterium]